VNQSFINYGLIRNVQNWLTEGRRLNYRKPIIQLGGKYYTILSVSLEYPGN
jgi:hypothetical protein